MSSSKVWAIKIWYAEFVFVFCFLFHFVLLSICFGFPFLKVHSQFNMKYSPNLGSIQYQLNVS